MNVLFSCGGTAGHINPALALAGIFRQKDPSGSILFVGAKGGMEERLVAQAGYELRTVTITPFFRSLSPRGVTRNLATMKNLRLSRRQAREILRDFPADLAVGTGGYASYPILREAARQKIPTAIHEANAVAGVTSHRLARFVDLVMSGFPDCESSYPHPERVLFTGTPVREEFFAHTRSQARRALGISDDRPVLLSYWGSLGAEEMNRIMVDFIALYAQKKPGFHHIHGAGRSYEAMQQALRARGVTLPPGVQLREYIQDMPQVMAAADLVLCRGGAATLSELTALGKPAMIVPSPYVTHDHQNRNAKVLEQQGAIVLCPESLCTGEMLLMRASRLLADFNTRQQMGRAMQQAGRPQAGEEIYRQLKKLANEKKNRENVP